MNFEVILFSKNYLIYQQLMN